MSKENAYAAGMFILGLAVIIALVVGFLIGAIDLVLTVIGAVLMVFLVIVLLMYLGIGVFSWAKKKDQVHSESGMTLDDVTEVDREMERK